jgi:hypothetical protein
VAESIKLSAEKLEAIWNAGAKSGSFGTPQGNPQAGNPATASGSSHESGAHHEYDRPRDRSRTHSSAGRGSLMRQAIGALLRFPVIAANVSDAERADLEHVDEAGIELLRELLDNLRAQPAQLPAQVVERWTDRPEQVTLVKLLQKEDVISDAAAAAGELRAALVKLGELGDEKRFEVLKARVSASGMDALDASELLEFKRLATRKRGGV